MQAVIEHFLVSRLYTYDIHQCMECTYHVQISLFKEQIALHNDKHNLIYFSNWEVPLPSLLPKLRESAVSPVRDTRKIR